MKKSMVPLVFFALLATFTLCASDGKILVPKKAEELKGTFTYKSPSYTVFIEKNGYFYGGYLQGKEQFFTSIGIQGSYETTEKYDTRMNQGCAKNVRSTVEITGAGTRKLVFSGTLWNKKYPECADYVQIVMLEPDRITVRCKVTQKVEMSSKMLLFRSIVSMPLPAIVDRGSMVKPIGRTEDVLAVPVMCEPGKGIKMGELQSFRVSGDKGVFSIQAGKDTALSVMDCRSWGEKHFRIDIGTNVVWHSKAVVYPAGKVWEWSMTFQFAPHKD